MLTFLLLSTAAQAECMPLSLDEVSAQARTLLSQAEADLALQKVDEAIASLSCRDELVRAEDLSELYQVGGTAARQAGDAQRSAELFARAARMVAPAEYYSALGEPDRATYQSALDDAAPPHSARIVTRAMVFADGVELRAGIEQGAPAGPHLIQTLREDGAVVSSVIELPTGGRLTVGAEPAGRAGGRRGLAIAGASLTALGVGALAADVAWASNLSRYPEQDAPLGAMNALMIGGIAASGAGAALMMSASFKF